MSNGPSFTFEPERIAIEGREEMMRGNEDEEDQMEEEERAAR